MNSESMTARVPTLAGMLLPRSGKIETTLLAIGGSLLLAVSAKIQVPSWPVPMTLQSLAVLLIGIGFGSRLGVATILVYLAEGLFGLPVFAGPLAGPAYFAGPTAGYLLGFLLSAATVGALAERGWDRNLLGAGIVLVAGHVLIFIPGVLWLAVLFGPAKAVAVGVLPFITGSIVKTALGIAIVALMWQLADKKRQASMRDRETR
ncbi:MAG TPA: biotin transporter BioY [Alphaproteobacteria bacterium]|nr:biotin transporter BioY [Alphaproteobacteria bacterium]